MRKPTRVPKITHSEIITILLVYQRSHFKDFRNFYGYFKKEYSHFFPNLPTYERFNELQKRVLYLMMLFLKALLVKGSEEGYIDSTKIDVCHLKRSKRNKVFAEKSATGYSSMGYFYGFKLHLVIDIHGNIVNATILPGNESDIHPVEKLLKNFKGTIFGDKGYISKKLFENLLKNGTKLVTKIKKNMKNQLMIWREKVLLGKRSLIESVFNILKNELGLVHSRHRCITNFYVHIMTVLIAYQISPKKPHISEEYLIM